MNQPLFSIVLNNFNYGRFLARAIESALAQDYPRCEVIVVDDGSTDDSREIIARYGSRVIPVLKPNGGQASAFNAGFAASSGEFISYLDSDDMLRPDAVTHFVAAFTDKWVAKVQSRLRLIDAHDRSLGAEEPAGELPGGDWKDDVLRFGPSAYPSTPTSANAWPRWFLETILPMPEPGYRVCADGYLKNVAPLFGLVASLQEPLVDYRIHGANTSHWGVNDDPAGRLRRDIMHYELACEHLARWANHLGHACDPRRWIDARWQHLARRHVLFRLSGEVEFRVPLAKCVRAALHGSLARRPLALGAVAAIYGMPRQTACALVFRLFRKKRIGEGLAVPVAPPASSVSPLQTAA